MSVSPDADEVARAGAVVTRLVERAALDGSTWLPAEVLAASLLAAGVPDATPGIRAADEAGDVAAGTEEGLVGHAEGAVHEQRVADRVGRLVAASGERAVVVVDAPRGADPGRLVDPLLAAVEPDRVLRLRGDGVARGLGGVDGADLVVLERADLLGLADAAQLVAAVRDGSRLVVVGDPAMPPAAGPGRALADLCDSGALPVLAAPYAGDGDDATATDPLGLLVRSLREGVLPPLDPDRREVVVTPATDAEHAVRRAVQLVTGSVPQAFGIAETDTLVLAPRAEGATGAEALRAALAEAGAGSTQVHTCVEAVGHAAEAIVLVLGAEAGGSLTRDLLVGAATEAKVHLSVVHQAGPALAEAVARCPHRTRRTRLARLLADALR